MKAYGQFCPLAQATQLLCERWTLSIVPEMIAGSSRFSELQRGAPLLSPTLLSARLKQRVKAGVVALHDAGTSPTDHLTPAGQALAPSLNTWASGATTGPALTWMTTSWMRAC